ncbi:hypothetical protein LQ948_18640 [Jiella sp. MQZ9-1]|uniref:Uncharacterized protein n=1 Tax=Jiella flava TaxID=2816857 RepID=A0A939JXK6_9HYPH|nr:hypothetical protein [Jiella flava]MBO0664177.1 hypothetical protein [Jiella flava]MCD2473207.1 hypothetical protein [Jiella flava]
MSTQNKFSDNERCGNVYVFVDSDSGRRIGFAGAFVYKKALAPSDYDRYRQWLAGLLVKGDGGDGVSVDVSPLGPVEDAKFSRARLRSALNGAKDPSGWMVWDIGLRNVGDQSLVLFDGVMAFTDPRYQTGLTPTEKASADKLSKIVTRWREESERLLTQ